MKNGTDALMMVFSRNAFYKRLHYLILAAFALSVLVIAILLSVIIFLIKNPTRPLYFATDNVGRLIQIIPVNQPNMTADQVAAWVTEAVQATLSYDFVNFHSQVQSAQKYFTDYGWSNYMKALTASNNLLGLAQNKWVIIAQIFDRPKIITQGLLSGAYAYKFEMPVLLTYWYPPYDDNSKRTNALQVSVIVQRRPILQSYKGLGIVQLIANLVTSDQSQSISGEAPG